MRAVYQAFYNCYLRKHAASRLVRCSIIYRMISPDDGFFRVYGGYGSMHILSTPFDNVILS